MARHRNARVSPLTLLIAIAALAPTTSTQLAGGESGWVEERDDARGVLLLTMNMTLHPRGEPEPALRHRFLPNEFELIDGNAATFYLSAMGFFEQGAVQARLREISSTAREQASSQNKRFDEFPPYSWYAMTPEQLPVDEVRDYIRLLSFQKRYLEEAVRRRHFDLDRRLSEIDDVVQFGITEIQVMRELARNQSLRCKLAIAEGRTDEAMAILGQQFGLARHLGQDVSLVSGLVGNSVAATARDDALQLAQRPNTPNLYWAYASLPRPLINPQLAFDVEHDLFYLQFKPLREVDDRQRSVGYWRDLVDELIPTLHVVAQGQVGMSPFPKDPDEARGVMTAMIAGVYPAAKRYLLEELGLPPGQVESYPTAQVVFLALVRFSDAVRDENFKWTHVPVWQARAHRNSSSLDDRKRADVGRLGWIAELTYALNVNTATVMDSFGRVEQSLALLQTVEAIRMYAADNRDRLPASLDDLPVPAVVDPLSGKPLKYQKDDGHAVLSGHPVGGHQYRLRLRIAPSGQRRFD